MVRFSVFNELSLPFPTNQNIVEKFTDFFKLLAAIQKKGLDTLRLSKNFKDYEILQGVNFQQFVGQQQDKEFKRKIISFLMNKGVVLIDSPLIKNHENQEQNTINSCEYFYNKQSTDGELACCDVWNTLAISFNSSRQWDINNIPLQKNWFLDNNLVEKTIRIQHASKIEHLTAHQNFFNDVQIEINLAITQENFWENKQQFFPDIIIFCPEIESQIKKLDKIIFHQAINLLREIETQRKLITDYSHSGESESVGKTPALRKIREFIVKGEKIFFENHIKSLPNGYRIYFLKTDKNIYIGYIGKHLKGKKDK